MSKRAGLAWWASAVGCGALLALPALGVPYPVVTDLPQHLSQLLLFREALANPGAPLAIQWGTPYLLGYLVPALAWLVASPEWVGRLTVALFALLWSGAVHAFARRRGRPMQAAMLACIPFFGSSLQWGFFSFLSGWLFFLAWLPLCTAVLEAPAPWRRWALVGVAALALYWAHVLWLALGGLWLLVYGLLRRAPARTWLGAAAACAPSVALALRSALGVHRDFDNVTLWGPTLLERLSPSFWADAAVSNTSDWVPVLVVVLLVGWLALGVLQRDGERDAGDVATIAAGVLCTTLVLLLPTRYTNTVQFEARWASPALALLLLGAPAPRVRPGLANLAAVACVTGLAFNVWAAWFRVNEDELDGLDDALAEIPRGARVLGLSFMQRSAVVGGVPFVQTFAWAQVRRGATLNFSFADFAPMPVVYRPVRVGGWTPGLEWTPWKATVQDALAFDYLLVGAVPSTHDGVAQRLPVTPSERATTWRTYRVVPSR